MVNDIVVDVILVANNMIDNSNWVSNSPLYEYTINMAISSSFHFNQFKSNPGYYRFVGSPSAGHHIECVKNVTDKNKPLLDKIFNEFAKIDTVGRPLFKCGRVSSEVSRYAEDVGYLTSLIPSMDGLTITEFGANVGSLAYCVLTHWPTIKSYNMVDLEIVNELSKKYLNALGFAENQIVYNQNIPSDLFISTYALSEMLDWSDLWSQYGKDTKYIFLRINFNRKEDENDFIQLTKETHNIIALTDECKSRMPNKVFIAEKK